MNKLSLRIKPDISEILPMQKEINRFAETEGWSAGVLYQIDLSLDELATNILSYGQTGGQVDHIDILITSAPDSVRIEISDNGVAFNPLKDAPIPDLDAPVATRAIGGLGVHIVRTVMDEVHYRREDGKNFLTLVKQRNGKATEK